MLGAEIITVAVFSVVYRPFDLNIYLWGGRSVTHGLRLYQVMADHNWFTYPFSAALFTPLDAVRRCSSSWPGAWAPSPRSPGLP